MHELKLRKHRQKTNHDAETNSDVKKSKNRRKQNLEDEANNMQLDKEDTQRSNLSSILLFVFTRQPGSVSQKARYLAV